MPESSDLVTVERHAVDGGGHALLIGVNRAAKRNAWNLAGYQQINVQVWVKGGAGKVYMDFYFNNLSAYQEELVIGGVGPGGWGIATLTR